MTRSLSVPRRLLPLAVAVALVGGVVQPLRGQGGAPYHLDFDGINDYAAVTDADALSFGNGTADTPLTIELWFRPDSMTNKQNLLGKWTGGSAQEYKLFIASGTIRLDLFDSSAQAMASAWAAQSALVGNWHHLAVTYDGRGGATAANGISLYVDGVAVALTRMTSATYVAMENGTAALQIGREGNTFKQYDGGLDEIRMWNVARTQAEIQAHMAAELAGGADPGLVAYWRLNEGSGTVAADTAPGALTATLNNGPTWTAGGPIAPANPDVTPPEIADVAATNVTASSAVVSFTTNETTTGWISLTPTGSCPCTDVYSAATGVSHTINLTGLAAETLYTYTAKARDAAGNTQTAAAMTFTTPAAPPDTTAPTVSISSPAAGTVSNIVNVQATATDNVGVAGVQFRVDGEFLAAEDVTAPYSVAWDTRTAADGPHTITADARDAAGNTSTASVSVSVSNVPSSSTPYYLEFDGVDDYLTVADANGLSFGNGVADVPLTLELWVRPDSTVPGQNLVSKWAGGSPQEYKLHITSGVIRFDLYDGSAQAMASAYSSQPGLAGGWHHIAVTYDGRGGSSAATGIVLYVDGLPVTATRVTSATYVAMENGTSPLQIGRESTNSKRFDGGLDELRMWSVVRSQAQVQASMSSELPDPGAAGLMAYWRFNDGSGTIAADASPGGHSATLMNGTAWVAGGPITPAGSEAPAITSAASATFQAGVAGTFTVVASGAPAPAISASGALPAGVTFVDNANGTATISGTPASGGSYPLTLTASNGVGSPAAQTFTLTVTQGAAITSAAATTFQTGSAGTFTVTTGGFPVPTLSWSGTLPAGVTLNANGNGTATLAGTPATASGGTYPLTITAANGSGSPATQTLTLTVTQAPAITSVAAAAFPIGSAGSVTITATGFPVPSLAASGALPAGVAFVDNGNGTATLAGSPDAGAGGVYPLTLSATNGVGAAATQAFTLTVQACTIAPPAGSLSPGTFGSAYAFAFTANGGAGHTYAVTAGALPGGLALSGAGSLTGVPSGTGTSSFSITATNSEGCAATNAYTLTIAPDAHDETFSNGVGNTQYSVGAGSPGRPAVVVSGTVLANDQGPGPFQAGPASIASVQGGHVAMSPAGTFLYTPPPGFAGPSDTFTYILTDANGATDSATVTIVLGGVVWYVDASAGAGDGRSHNPFNTMTAASSAALAGHVIYVHQGSPAGGATLKQGQTLWGAGSLFAVNGLVIPATTAPTLQGTITLANDVTVSSLAVNGAPGAAVVANGLTGTEVLDAVSIVGGSTGLQFTGLAGTLNMTGGAIGGVSGADVLVNGGSGVLTIGASIVNTAGHSVDVQGRTAGTVTFSGSISDTGTGILLNANSGSTVAFSGGLTLSTGANAAFTAAGGGVVTVTQDNVAIVNTITTTSGIALSVKDTEIGAAGLTFRSISAGSTSFTSGVGIILENTGTAAQNGGLTVTGNGTAQSGGIIRRKTGADGATNAGIGIYLSATKNASFSWMDLNRFDNSAIAGRNVSGFLLANSVINGAGTTPGIAEGPIVFGLPVGVDGLHGAGIIRNSQILAGVEDNVAFYGHAGSMSLLIESTTANVSDCTIGPNSTTTGGHGLLVQTDDTAVASVTVNRCRVRNNRVTGIFAAASGDSNLTLLVTGSATDAALKSQISRSASGGQGQDGVVAINADDADVTATVENTVITGLLGAGVWVGQAPGNASALSMLRATIASNRIDSPAGAGTSGVVARFSSRPGEVSHARLLVANNSTPISAGLNQYGTLPAIAISTPDAGSSPAADVILIGNHIDMRESAPGSGIRGPIGVNVVGTQGSLCANILSNISHLYPVDIAPQGGGLRLEQGGAGVVQLEGGTQPAGSPAGPTLAANNPAPGNTTMITEAVGAVEVVANGACQLPSAP